MIRHTKRDALLSGAASSLKDDVDTSSNAAAERVARDAYGRVLAAIVRLTRDITAAEDALAEAFVQALSTWPRDGVPERPEAWLLTAARRRFIDSVRHENAERRAREAISRVSGALDERPTDRESPVIPDERLNLLFVCAHPAIDSSVRTPLMLQTVLGIDAARIASTFLVAPATLAQRLVRAKRKIKQAAIRFELPAADALPARLDDVLACIYSAYTVGWRDPAARGASLADQAIWLAERLCDLTPDEPEALGLLALLYFSRSRAAAQGGDDLYVPLSEQHPATWDTGLIESAERLLSKAASLNRPGRFQIEAAIQSAHAERAHTGRTNWAAILHLYDHLIEHAPSVGAIIARSAVLVELGRAGAALEELDTLAPSTVLDHQPYWATRAKALSVLGRRPDAADAYARAAGLADHPAIRTWLLDRRAAMAVSTRSEIT